jgi:maltoporin
LTIQHNQSRILGGSNALVFQYGSGAFAHASGTGPDQLLAGGTTRDRQWRVIEHLVVNPAPELSGAVVLVYQNKSAQGPMRRGSSTFSAEIRPAYHLNDYFKLAADAFFQAISMKDAGPGEGTPMLLKLTAAPTFVLGRGYYARPELRFFVTYATWNGAAARAGAIGSGAFPDDRRSGLSFGASIEQWF